MRRRRAIGLLLASISLMAVSARGQSSVPAVRIDAKIMRVKGGGQRAVFTGDVVVRRGEDRLECLRLTVHYDDAGVVERFVADGQVHMTRGDRHLRSDRAELDNRRNLVTLTGDPVMEEGQSVIRGELMRYDLEKDEVEVQQVQARVELERVVPEDTEGDAPE